MASGAVSAGASSTCAIASARNNRFRLHSAFFWLASALALSGAAHAERNFAVRYDADDRGDILIVGNTLMSCIQGTNNPPSTCLASVPVSGTGATGGNLDDNNYAMRLVNAAGGTSSSSSADLSLPLGSNVLWAGLYWGADTSAGTNGSAAANASLRGQIRFSIPGGAYQTVAASQVDAATGASQPNRYSAFADVTSLVQGGGTGTYRVADIQAGTGGDRYGGWSLVVVVHDAAQPLRNLTVFDGYRTVNNAASTVNITVSGFRTPLSGSFTARAGAVSYEGDLGQTGDQLRVNGINLGNGINPTTNIFNSTISRLGTTVTAKTPNFANQMGFDADVFDASGILANGATSATLTFTTANETYYPAVLTFANDIYQPVVEGNVTKSVTDLDGGAVLPGDVLEYALTVVNTGNDAAVSTVLDDAIPANTTYVPGSLAITAGANAGAKSDATGDDQAEFSSGSVRFRLGTGATASSGGTLATNQSTSLVFRVQVNAGVAAGTTISNQASVTYNGATLGTPFVSPSDGDPNTPGAQPTDVVVGSTQARLSISKSATPNPVVAGATLTYTLHVDNNGPNDASAVVVTDALPSTTTFASASAPAGWTISAPAVGANGTVQFSAPALAVGGYDLVIAATVVAGTPGGTSIGNVAELASSNDPSGSHQAATSTLVANSGDLALAKTAPTSAGQGQQITYSLQLNHPGPDPATGVVVTDPLPANTMFVSAAAPPGWTASTPAVGANGSVTFSNATLAPGSYAFTIVAQIATGATLGSTLTNTASVTSTSADSNPANNSASAVTTVQNPVPSVTKTFTPAAVGSGVASTLRIAFTNNAAIALTGLAITDALPATPGQMRVTNPVTGAANTCGGTFTATGNATSIALANGTLAAGASCYVEVNVRATTIGNYANTTGNVTSNQTPTGPTASATLGVGLLAAPTTTKSFSPASVPLGGTAQMTIAFANPNAASITGVGFVDSYPAGIVNAASGVVASNGCGGVVTATGGGNSLQLASATIPVGGCAIVVNVVATQIGNSVNATGPVTSTNADTGPGGTGTLAVTPLAAPTATKSFAPATIAVGGTAAMTIAITNPNAVALTQLGFSDAYPAGLANAASAIVSNTCGGTLTADPGDASASLAGGTLAANASCSVVVDVVALADGALVNDTGAISSANAQSGVGASATLSVTPVADLSIMKTGPASVGLGAPLEYTIVVSNAGPSAAEGALFADTLPAGVGAVSAVCGNETGGAVCGGVSVAGSAVTSTITSLPPGASVTFTIDATAPTSGASLSNTATLAPPGGTSDPNASDNSSTATTTLLPAALSVTKSASPTPFVVGQPASYAITVQNSGAGATNAPITIADTLPSGITLLGASGTNWSCTGTTTLSCTYAGTLAAGASTTLTLNVAVAASATDAGNSATASGGGDPGCPAAPACTGTVPVGVAGSADIVIAKTVDDAAPNVGDSVVFTITASNAGPSDATGVAVIDALPSGLAFVSANAAQGSYDSGTGLWSVGAIANGASATLAITADVLAPGVLINTAMRTGGDQLDPDASNNSASASLNAQPTADLGVAKTVDDATPNLGTDVVFTITVANAGPNDASGVEVSDALPLGLDFVSANASQGSYDAGSGTWTVGAIANGASATLTLTATVSLPGDITNTAAISGANEFDPNGANDSGGVTVNGQSADIQVVKTVDDANPLVGDAITFTITTTNNGPSAATGVEILDTLPAGLAFVSAAASQGAYDEGSGIWTVGALAASGAGATATLSIVAMVGTDGGFTNTASVGAVDQPDPSPANNSSSVAILGVASADLSVIKIGPGSVVAGTTATYDFQIHNAGPSEADGVVLDDPAVAGLTFVSATAPCAGGFPCAIGTIARDSDVTVSATFAVASSASGTIANTAGVSGTTFDPDAGNDESTSTATVERIAEISVVKTGPASVTAGGVISYTVVVSNAGPGDADGTTFFDSVPIEIVFVTADCAEGGGAVCGVVNVDGNNVSSTIAALPAGASVTFTIAGSVPIDPMTLTNTAHVDPPFGVTDPDPVNDESTASTDVTGSADLSIAKDGDPIVVPGTNVHYTLSVANAGPSIAVAAVIDDPTPPGLVFVSADAPCAGGFPCALGDVGPGSPIGIDVTYAVPSGYAGGTILNTATISSATADPAPGNNSASVTTAVDPRADLAIAKSAPASVSAGAALTYTIVVSNLGPSDASGAEMSDPVPGQIGVNGASCGAETGGAVCGAVSVSGNFVNSFVTALPAGASVTFTIDGTAQANPATATNTATVSAPAGIIDPAFGNNASSATTTIGASADVSIVKTGPAGVVSGATIAYTLVVANAGPSAADGTTFADAVPSGITDLVASCAGASGGAVCAPPTLAGNAVSGNVPTLPAGGSVTIAISGTAPFGAATLTNTATVAPPAGTTDPDNGNDSSTVVTGVGAAADIAVAKSVDNAAPNVGDTVVFTIVAANAGPDDASGVAISDGLPFGFGFVSATATQGGYDAGTGIWSVGALANGANATLTITATIDAPGALTNTATVSASDQPDPDASNNSAGVSLNAGASADLAIAKSVDNATPDVGDTVVFTIALANNGPNDATGVEVTDLLPAGLTLVAATPSQGSYDEATGVWSVGDVADGGTAALDLSATVDDAGAIVNLATITAANENDPAPGNNESGAAVNGQLADLAVMKTVDNAAPNVGDDVTFTITIHDNGPGDASGVAIADALPAGLAFVSSSASQGSYDAATGVWTVGALTASGSAATATLSVVATVTADGASTNTARVAASDQPDPNTGNDSASASLNGHPLADLAIVKTGPATVAPGAAIVWSIVVSNAGPGAADGAAYSDAVPAGINAISATCAGESGGATCGTPPTVAGQLVSGTVATLPGGGSVVITISGTAPDAATTLTNTATVAAPAGVSDPDPDDNASSVSTDVVAGATSADLSVLKEGPASANAGGQIVYTLTVTNAGPDTAVATMIADATPAGLAFVSASAPCSGGFPCALGDLAPGASTIVTATYAIDAAASGLVVNTATVSSATSDPNALDNDSSIATTIVPAGAPSADLVVAKTGPATVVPGSAITYTIAVANNGPDAATNAVLDDPTPAGLSLVDASGPCSAGFPCALGTIAAGDGIVIRATFVVGPGVTGTVTNTASVTSDTADPDAANSSSTATTIVTGGVTPPPEVPIPVDARWMEALLAALLVLCAGGVLARGRSRKG